MYYAVQYDFNVEVFDIHILFQHTNPKVVEAFIDAFGNDLVFLTQEELDLDLEVRNKEIEFRKNH